MLPCSWKETFGVECPSCGAQRSFFTLLEGDLGESILLFPALIPLLITAILVLLHLWRPQRFAAKWIVWGVGVSASLMFLNWVLRFIWSV